MITYFRFSKDFYSPLLVLVKILIDHFTCFSKDFDWLLVSVMVLVKISIDLFLVLVKILIDF